MMRDEIATQPLQSFTSNFWRILSQHAVQITSAAPLISPGITRVATAEFARRDRIRRERNRGARSSFPRRPVRTITHHFFVQAPE
jgi:hypothetical protein